MKHRFGTATWSVEIPDSWNAHHDEDCATITDDSDVGALQISAAFKDSDVTDDDLRSFASDHTDAGAVPAPATCGDFVGIEIAFSDGQFFCRQWFLRSRQQALFVTHTCAESHRGSRDHAIDQALSTLVATGDHAD